MDPLDLVLDVGIGFFVLVLVGVLLAQLFDAFKLVQRRWAKKHD